MSTKIAYKNEFGSDITPEQQSSLNRYDKISYKDNLIKMIESIGKGRNFDRKTIEYFLDITENKNTILQQYTDQSNNVNCVVYFNNQSSNGYYLWDWESYSTIGTLKFRGKTVYDIDHKLIMYCSFDLNTGLLQEGAWKNCYANQSKTESEDQLLQIIYDVNGNVASLVDFTGKFGYSKSLTIDEFLADIKFSQVDFPWDQHPYYHSVLPYLPEGNL